MIVSDIMVREVRTAKGDEHLSKAMRRMEEYRIHQLPVVSGSELLGMLTVKDVLRFPHDVEKTKAIDLASKVPSLEPESTLQQAVDQIINLGVRALPIVKAGELAGVVSETDLIKNVEFLRDIPAESFMGDILVVKEGDRLGRATSIMAEQNVSRVPVVDESGKVTGCVDSLALMGFWDIPMESVRPAKYTAKEHAGAKDFLVKDYMRPVSTVEVAEFSLEDVVGRLQSSEEVVLVKSGRPVGMITPRDVLELAVMEEWVPIQVARIERIELGERPRVDEMLRSFVNKFDKIVGIQRLFVYVDTHDEGGRLKYSMRANLTTDKEVFRSRAHGWDVSGTLHMLLDNFERQVIDYKEKGETKRNQPKIPFQL